MLAIKECAKVKSINFYQKNMKSWKYFMGGLIKEVNTILQFNKFRNAVFKLLEKDKGVRECFINYHLIWIGSMNL